jgi:putative serine protease PepD
VDAAIGVTVGAEEIDGSESGISTVGVTLQSVLAGGAAEQAGLRAGDRVTKLNDYFTTTPDGLIAAVRRHAPGTTVEVTYVRDDKTRTARVTLGKV